MLTKREENHLKTYESQLQKPKWKFVLVYGLSWAMLAMFFTFLANLLFGFDPDLWKTGKSIAVNLVVWMIAGIAYGLLMYRILSKRLQKLYHKREVV